MTAVTVDSLATNESLPPRSRTFSPEVVLRVHEYLVGADAVPEVKADPAKGIEAQAAVPAVEPVKNLRVGEFDTEGAARSALTTLNKLLRENHGHEHAYAGTVRQTEDGKFRAIILNKPAKVVERKPKNAKKNGKPAA